MYESWIAAVFLNDDLLRDVVSNSFPYPLGHVLIVQNGPEAVTMTSIVRCFAVDGTVEKVFALFAR